MVLPSLICYNQLKRPVLILFFYLDFLVLFCLAEPYLHSVLFCFLYELLQLIGSSVCIFLKLMLSQSLAAGIGVNTEGLVQVG